MISIKEQAALFRAKHQFPEFIKNGREEFCQTGKEALFDLRLEESCCFLSSKAGILQAWRSYALWQACKQGKTVLVSGGEKQAEKDFLSLLSLESKIPKYRLREFILKKTEKENLPRFICSLEKYPVFWKEEESPLPKFSKPVTAFISLRPQGRIRTLADWKIMKKEGNTVLGFIEEQVREITSWKKIKGLIGTVGYLEVLPHQTTVNKKIPISLSFTNGKNVKSFSLLYDYERGNFLTKIKSKFFGYFSRFFPCFLKILLYRKKQFFYNKKIL